MSVNAAPTIIQLHGLTKHFGNVMALQDVSLDVPLGITGLLGPNGAGKSTLIKILLGLVRPSSGSGMVEGRDVLREGKAIRASVGFMPEEELVGLGVVAPCRTMQRTDAMPVDCVRIRTPLHESLKQIAMTTTFPSQMASASGLRSAGNHFQYRVGKKVRTTPLHLLSKSLSK